MALRLGGLISGMDTQTIIQKLMEVARRPLDKLYERKDKLDIKKLTFEDVDSQLTKLQRTLLDLRLESTFKSKNVASSNESYVTGSASVEAEPGIHIVDISQVAVSALVRSQYTRASLSSSPPNTAGIDSISGRPRNNLEGEHQITITDQGSYYRARSLFKPAGGGQIKTLSGQAAESSSVEGTIGQDIDTGSDKLVLTVNSQEVTVYLDHATANVTAMTRVAADMEDKINAALNTALDTEDVTYVVVRTSRDGTTGTDYFTIYNVSGSQDIAVNTTETTAAALGLSSGGTAGTASTIITEVTSKTLNGLLVEMNEPLTGLIPGVTFTQESDTGLQVGQAIVHTSASLNARGPSKSHVYGSTGVSSSGSLNTTVVGLENAGFANAPSTNTNGYFTINGVQITISNYLNLSVNDVLALINSSGAGVTATYDSTNDRIVLASLDNTSSPITLGDPTDTSDFLTVAKLTANQGASFISGSSSSSISTTSSLSSAGFTLRPTSGTFTINGVTLYVDASQDTIQDLIDKINNSGAKVVASYDAQADKFTLASAMGVTDSNYNKITLGSASDTSNILQALNLMEEEYASVTSTAAPSGDRGADTITITPYGSTTGTDVTVPATTGTGAYQSEAGIVNWIDGIAPGTVFTVLAGNDGNTSFTWTNNSGSTITDIDSFVEAWNQATNWSSSKVEVGVVKEGEDRLRFFSRADNPGLGTATFTITADSAFDLYELGLVGDPPDELSADSNTAALWHFNETSGDTAADSSANGVDATIDGASHVSGKFLYNGLYFDGTDDKVTASGSGSLNMNGNSQMAIEVWVNPEVLPATTAQIVEKGDSGYELSLDDAGHVVFTVWDSGGAHSFTTTATVTPGQWFHITASYDYSAAPNQMSVTINGNTETGTGTGAWTDGVIVDAGNTLTIGDSLAGGERFQGYLDELRISTTARTAAADGSWSANFTNTSTEADAEYNALNLAYAVNTTSGVGVQASTDGQGHVTFTSTTSGFEGGFTLSDEPTENVSTILDYFGSSSVSAQLTENREVGLRGQDAVLEVDGVSYTRTTNAVDDIVEGLTLYLHAPTTTPVSITITNDTDKALDKLTEFIVNYNETIAMLNPPRLTTEQQKYLEPLSDEDRMKMTFTEIEEYENNYRTYNGYEFIRRESALRLLYQSFRQIVTSQVSSVSSNLNALNEIGIVAGSVGGFEDARDGYLLLKPTGESDYQDVIRAALELNGQLMNALQNNADQVYELFAHQGSGSENDGLGRQLDELIDDYIGVEGLLDRQIRIGGSLDMELSDLNEEIQALEDRLDKQEERLWDQFTRMETELARLNEQSNVVSVLLSSMGVGSTS